MSGSLSTLGSGLSALDLGSVTGGTLGTGFLADILTTASLGGVTFDMIDSREAVGRRLARFLFPGRPVEEQKFQDFGTIDMPMHVTGYLAGDDYVLRATRMRKVLLKAGRQTFVHPWWGRLKVRVLEPGEIQFSATSLRVAKFSVALVRDPGPPSKKGLFASIADTLTNLLEAADAVVDAATIAIQSVMSVLAIPLALSSMASSMLSQVGGIFDSLIGSAPQPVKSATSSASRLLSDGVSAPTVNADTTYADAITAALAAVPAALVDSISAPDISALAPAQQQIEQGVAETVDAKTVADILLSAAVQTGSVSDALSHTPEVTAEALALGVAARSLIVSQLMSVWGSFDFVSGADALAQRDKFLAAIDALLNDLENAAASSAAVSFSGLWKSIHEMRMALIADCSTQVGRLPVVVDVTLNTTLTGWALAYALAGDDVTQVQRVFEDLITRNNVAHPALVGPGVVQLLEQNP